MNDRNDERSLFVWARDEEMIQEKESSHTHVLNRNQRLRCLSSSADSDDDECIRFYPQQSHI